MKYWLTIGLNSFIAIATLIIMISFFQPKNGRTGWQRGKESFMYFTIQSIGFSAIVSAITVVLMLTGKEIPQWLMVTRFVATVTVTLTCLTVMVWLGPLYGYKMQLSEENLPLHLISPVFALISTCFLENGMKLQIWQMLLGIIPVVLYGALYIYKVNISKQWKDFYGFNKVNIAISATIMLILTAAICLINGKLYN